MKRSNIHAKASATGLICVLLGLTGCLEYRIDTRLNADGSGLRSERLSVSQVEESDLDLSADAFVAIMDLTERDGWTHARELQGNDTADVFYRERRIRNQPEWSDLTGSVHIAGTTDAGASTRVGYVRLGDVHFRNEVKIETGRVSDGRSFSYRETFYWTDAMDAVVEYFMDQVGRTVRAKYPNLSEQQVGEIVGLTRGQVWGALDQGLLDAGDDDGGRLLDAMVERTAVQSAKIARQGYPDADADFFRAMLDQLYEDEEDRLGEFTSRSLPGFDLGGRTEIIFRLVLPGRVTASNAEEQEGDTLVWKFSPGDAMLEPVELFAESVVSG